jgi:sugar phosphate isomerase/epimerase
MQDKIKFSVFTKPWPGKSIEELGRMAHWLGFDGIELPVRPGFPVNPDNATVELPRAAKTLAAHNVKIYSVASVISEQIVAACAEASVPTLRVMAPIGAEGYAGTEQRLRKEFDAAMPILERHNMRIGVQNHSGKYICNACGLRSLLSGYDPRRVEIVWPHLCMVNLKNAIWKRKNAADGALPEWSIHWTPGREGLASWSRVAAELKRRSYGGVVCLTAEYSDEAQVDKFIAEDLAFARTLM